MSERKANPIRWHVVGAIARRDIGAHFASPTGYVFITLFVFLSAFAAFWLPGFFERNIDSLDQLNSWYPMLLLIIAPAIAMGAWAEERRSGTIALLQTLPAGPASIVVGKQLAAMVIFSVALAFATLGEAGVLFYLGSPDIGLLIVSLFGQWLAGIAIVAVALAAGSAARSPTIAFVSAALAGAFVVSQGWLLRSFPIDALRPLAALVDFPKRLEAFGRGVVTPSDVAYFIGIRAIGVGVNVFLLDRRRYVGAPGLLGRDALFAVRFVASIVALAALVVLLGRTPLRLDLTAERLWSLSGETRELLHDIDTARPVQVTAFVSDEAPGRYAQTRATLLGLLETMRGDSGGRLQLRVVRTEPYTEAARDARQGYGITPAVLAPETGAGSAVVREVYLGVAVERGAERRVIPLLTPGLPVEYELARAIRGVSSSARQRVGILDTEANIFGAFDYSTLQPGRDWPLVDELRKQHEVERISPDQPIPESLGCLIVAQPSTLTDAQLAHLIDYLRNGGPALLFEDPFPQVNPGIASAAPRGAGRNPFVQTPEAESAPKADMKPLWDLLGVIVPADRIIWDGYKPHPQFAGLPPEIVFVGPGSGMPGAINEDDPVTSGLQEVVLLAPGELRENPTITLGKPPTVIPLLRTSPVGGHTLYAESVGMTLFGPQWPLPDRKFYQTTEAEVLAARLFGRPADTDPGDELVDSVIDPEQAKEKQAQQRLRVIIIADLDVIAPDFFALRAVGAGDLQFDNVPLVLNSVDLLLGDASLIELRKRRRTHRTLTRLDDQRQELLRESRSAIDAAGQAATERLDAAQARIDDRVAQLRARTDLDETTQRVMIESMRRNEQRKLTAQRQRIEDEKDTRIADARAASIAAIDAIEFHIRVAAVGIPPVPALAIGAVVFWRRRRHEREGVAQERLR
ncbi:MAG: Gldg family protein [Phycisphaeraceae bacterium]|nr:Gldg family protein [Phycisphaeraceae bacterium]